MRVSHAWHGAINNANRDGEFKHWMYEAKKMADEVPRGAMLFGRERRGDLVKTHQQCSCSKPAPVEDNHVRCALGKACRDCPYLKAIEASGLTPEQIDIAKAWTCAAHIISEGGDVANEGYFLTNDDIMFWQRTHENLAAAIGGDND